MVDPQPTNQQKARADVLVQIWLEGNIADAAADELHGLISTYPELGERVLGQLQTSQMVRELIQEDPSRHFESLRFEHLVEPASRARQSAFGSLKKIWIAAPIAGACLCMLLAFSFWRKVKTPESAIVTTPVEIPVVPIVVPSPEQLEGTSKFVAVVSSALSVKASQGQEKLDTGSQLLPGRVKLQSGLMVVDFFNGARVGMEGPCEFELFSRSRIGCESGKIMVTVPGPARGFQIVTPHGNIRDLESVSGVEVTPQDTLVRVVSGSVEIAEQGNQPVAAGSSVRIQRGQILSTKSGIDSQFISVEQIDEMYSAAVAKRKHEWNSNSKQLNLDPGLLLRFDFRELKNESNSLLINRAAYSSVANGTIQGCETVSSRWPGERALSFQKLSDRVSIDFPDPMDAMTVTAWVRIDSYPDRFAGILMSDGAVVGGIHWQLTFQKQIRLCYFNGARQAIDRSEFDTPPVLTEQYLGKWVHLALVLDTHSQRGSQYFNGLLVAEGPVPMAQQICIRTASLGNWTSTEDAGHPRRVLNGDMSEVTVHARLLSDQEIFEIYNSGSPQNIH